MALALNKQKQLDNLTDEIWKSAERLRGKFKSYEYQSVILPIIVIRRLECVLIASVPDAVWTVIFRSTNDEYSSGWFVTALDVSAARYCILLTPIGLRDRRGKLDSANLRRSGRPKLAGDRCFAASGDVIAPSSLGKDEEM